VAFLDVTAPAVPAIAEKPIATLKLPKNFFHPYYMSGSTQLERSYLMFVSLVLLFT